MNQNFVFMGRQLARKSVLASSSNFLITLFGFISMIFIKRFMGYETVGMLAFALAYVHLFSIIGDLGFGTAHLKRVNEKGLDEGKCNAVLISVKLILNFIMIGVVLATILVSKHVFHYKFETKTLELILYLTILKAFFDHLIAIFKNIYSGKLEIAKAMIPKISGRFLQMVLKISIAVLGFSAVYLVAAEIVVSILILSGLILLFRGHVLKKPDWNYFKHYATFAFPVIFIGTVATLTHGLDKVMIQFFVGSEAVGVYTIPQRITMAFLLVSGSITGLLFPTFSNLYSNKKFNSINRLSNEAVKYISITLVPAVVFLFLFADPLMVLLFGSDATKSTPILQVLLLAIYIDAVRTPYGIQITSTGHLKIAMAISAFALVLNTSLNIIFIPDEIFGIRMMGLGALGAALTTLISLSLRGILAKHFAYKLTKTKGYHRIWTHLVAGGFSAAGGYLFYNFSTVWYLLPGYFFAIMGIYLGIMYALKEFGKEELYFYLNTIHPGKMKKYVTDELKGK